MGTIIVISIIIGAVLAGIRIYVIKRNRKNEQIEAKQKSWKPKNKLKLMQH